MFPRGRVPGSLIKGGLFCQANGVEAEDGTFAATTDGRPRLFRIAFGARRAGAPERTTGGKPGGTFSSVRLPPRPTCDAGECVNRVEMHMATVQGVNNMTLNQQEKMYNAIQANCVIVTSGYAQSSTNSVIQGKRALAPAPERNTVLITNNSDIRCKRKIQFIPHSGPNIQPASVARRNARERNRVKQVNNGFAALRQHIPPTVLTAYSPQNANTAATGRGANKKLSKVETLKMAVEYIRSLQQMLEDHEAEISSKNAISENNISENRFYTNSPDTISQQFTNYPLILPTPPASESSSSPTPSHTSEGPTPTVFTSAAVYKRYGYDNYDPHSPEDEELLDAIFSWQQNS
ncbi:hypothetical protein FQA39_LY06047 [Lamprigera yunnana]|nr:hypothetical protein FQA39_LY06047 [Lamprigera yunnana]